MKYTRGTLFFSVIGIFVATAVVTLCGVIGILTIQSGYLDVLFTTLVIELVAAVIGLFKATDWFGTSNSFSEADIIKGCWWQFIRYRRKNAISFVEIKYSQKQQQFVINGHAYDAQGNPHAHWWSVGASLNAATLEFRYFWKGDRETAEADFSGFGYWRFNNKPDRAIGWYTWMASGGIDDLHFTGNKQKVELRLASKTDVKTMLSNDRKAKGELASSVYSYWSEAVKNS